MLLEMDWVSLVVWALNHKAEYQGWGFSHIFGVEVESGGRLGVDVESGEENGTRLRNRHLRKPPKA